MSRFSAQISLEIILLIDIGIKSFLKKKYKVIDLLLTIRHYHSIVQLYQCSYLVLN